jgi:hypothetical protein
MITKKQAPIARVGLTETGPGQERAIRVVQALHKLHELEWPTRIGWVPRHTDIGGTDGRTRLVVKQRPTTKQDEPLLPGPKGVSPDTIQ